jgi:hypothetical protein
VRIYASTTPGHWTDIHYLHVRQKLYFILLALIVCKTTIYTKLLESIKDKEINAFPFNAWVYWYLIYFDDSHRHRQNESEGTDNGGGIRMHREFKNE